MANANDWIAELRYCAWACANRGTDSVPEDCVGNYLATQAAGARRAGAFVAEHAFSVARQAWDYGRGDSAAETLNRTADILAEGNGNGG